MLSHLDIFTALMSIIVFGSIFLTLVLIVVHNSKRELRLIREKHEAEINLLEAKRTAIIGALAGGMAFYLNNILQAIEEHVSLLKANVYTKEIADLSALITKEIRKALMVSDRLYLITHPTELEMHTISLIDLIASMGDWITNQLPDSVKVITDFHQHNGLIIANQSLLRLALQSIITNSVEAMPDGGTLTIGLSNVDNVKVGKGSSEAQFLVVSISDTGYGMDEDTKRQLFEPFFTTKTGFDRLGLGLSLTYGILKIHQARGEVESEVNQGTTISLFFPSASEKEIIKFTAGEGRDGFRSPKQQERILLTDTIVGKT